MKIIPRNIHGVLDYVVGLLFIAAPFLFGFADVPAARNILIVLGCAALVYSLLTAYELGAVKMIPFQVHLWLDAASGILLVASPWLFGFADQVRWPHVVLGLLELGAVAMTRTDAATVTPRRA
jgi:hypothetical protein